MSYWLIADAGGTKVHWAVADSDGRMVEEFFSGGVNPAVMSVDRVRRTIVEALCGRTLPLLEGVLFYGAGCKGEEPCASVRAALCGALDVGAGAVRVESDMLGVCHALLGNQPGVACILGTGANSCVYNGRSITGNVAPGGFILGDEGSGAWLGRNFASDLLKGLLPAEVAERFYKERSLTPAEIIRHVYRPESDELPPNRFLASFAPFMKRNLSEPSVRNIVERGFNEFFERNVCRYFGGGGSGEVMQRTVHFVGSVAVEFAGELRNAASRHGFEVGNVLRSPMEGLLRHLDCNCGETQP